MKPNPLAQPWLLNYLFVTALSSSLDSLFQGVILGFQLFDGLDEDGEPSTAAQLVSAGCGRYFREGNFSS